MAVITSFGLLTCCCACTCTATATAGHLQAAAHLRRVPHAPCASIVSEYTEQLEAAREVEAEYLTSLSGAITNMRQIFYDTVPRLDLPMLAPSLSFQAEVATTRELLREVLVQERIISVAMLATATVAAIVGARTRPAALAPDADELDALCRTELSSTAAIRYDRGFYEDEDAASDSGVGKSGSRVRARGGVGPGQVLELILCVLLDAAGDVSLFYPVGGELGDIGFAILSAFVIELFFDWPALALFGLWEVRTHAATPALASPPCLPSCHLWKSHPRTTVPSSPSVHHMIDYARWCASRPTRARARAAPLLIRIQEALPFADFIPTATIGWLLVEIVGARPKDRGLGQNALLRSTLDDDFGFAPGVRPPPADRRSYLRPDAHLIEGSRPWEVD